MADHAFNFWREKERESHGSSRLEKVTANEATHASRNTTKPATAVQTNSTEAASDGSLKFPAAARQEVRSDSVKPPRPSYPPYKPSHVLQTELERGRVKQTKGVVLDGPPKWFESGASRGLMHRGSRGFDDNHLNKPKRRQAATWGQGTHVSQLAERLNLMLSSTPPSLPHRDSDPSSTHSSRANPHRAHSAKLLSRLQPISGGAVKEKEEEGANNKVPRWRSFSGSRGKPSSSVKIRSSGFICYLDGPEERARGDSFCEGHTHKVSSMLISLRSVEFSILAPSY